MRYVRITTIFDEAVGDLGFTLKRSNLQNDGEFFVSGDGLLIAHDLLEHQQGIEKIGVTLEDEIIAFGGVIYIRGITGNLGGGIYSPEENLGMELADFFRYVNDNKPIRKHYPKKRDHDEYPEHDFIWYCTEKMSGVLYENSYEEYYTEEDNRRELIDPYVQWVRHNLKYGVWLAEKRFGCNYEAMSMFNNIRNEVNLWKPEYEGKEYILGYDKRIATMRELEYSEY